MDYIVAATAGHVDHGKTTLIRRLTGTDTDTAPEEKQRGLTINLGFAYFDLPSKRRIAFVDVPGHEKFLRNMISGLSGIDMALLVVDAGEAVMPQTREHAAILTLLGIKHFVIAVTKADTVEPEMCELTIEDIREQFKNTPLEKAPLVITDAVSGRGLNELVAVIDKVAKDLKGHKDYKHPRLNIDRVFTIKGHGTVVTGTLIDGLIKLGDQLEIYPTQLPVRVKNIQVNEDDQQIAFPDHRVALNLDVKNEQVHKGEVITTPGNVKASKVIDAYFTSLPNSGSLKLNERIRLYIGSTEAFGRVYPMETDSIKPGKSCFMQVRLEDAIAVKNGDRFIVRTYSPMITIGGGKILSANAKHHSRNNQSVLKTLQLRLNGEPEEIIDDYLGHVKANIATLTDLANLLDMDHDDLHKKIDMLVQTKHLAKLETYYCTEEHYQNLEKQVINMLIASQRKHPLREGISRPELISKLNQVLPFSAGSTLLNQMEAEQLIKISHDLVSTKDFQVRLTQQQKELKMNLKAQLAKSGLVPVSLDSLIESSETVPMLDAFDGQDFIKLNDGYYMARTSYSQIIEIVKKYLINHPDGIGISEYRDLTNTSRKYAVMVLERLDKDHVTKRLNRKHVLN